MAPRREEQDGVMRNDSESNNSSNSNSPGRYQNGDDDDPRTKLTNNQQQQQHAPIGLDRVPVMDAMPRPSTIRRESFLAEFASSNGPPQIVLLIMMLALGFGSTIGVVPAVMSDRYARLNHGYTGSTYCADYNSNNAGDAASATGTDKPEACLLGFADAQNAVAYEQLVSNLLTFFTSSLVGSLSDEHGRRGILLLGISLSLLSPLSLVLVQLVPTLSPTLYYAAGTVPGLVNWIAVALSSLSDVMPPKWRAPSFGLLLAGFSLGFALAPLLALWMGHFRVSVFSLTLVASGFLMTLVWFPETLPPEEAAKASDARERELEHLTPSERREWNIKRPLWELAILNRNRLFRLLSLLAFFSGLVSSGDRTLLLYYLEERLGFDDGDVALMFLIMGVLGIFVQGVFLKFLNDAIGERWVVTLCFVLGVVVNLMYGLAQAKSTIFVAVAIGAFGGMAFPTISAIKANNVESSEQGRIQGALFSLSALASGLGPMVLRFVYHYTKDGAFLGPGSMFVVAAMLYLVAVYAAYLLPTDANSNKQQRGGEDGTAEVTEMNCDLSPDSLEQQSPSTPLI